MCLLSNTVTSDVVQLLLEDPAEDAGANMTEETSDGGDNNTINLNQAITLIQKVFNFQGIVDPTVNNNSTPQPDLNTVDANGGATVGEKD